VKDEETVTAGFPAVKTVAEEDGEANEKRDYGVGGTRFAA